MNISELSIRRPVMASVLTIIILLFGFIGYSYLGVREYPSVDNPIISVTCSYLKRITEIDYFTYTYINQQRASHSGGPLLIVSLFLTCPDRHDRGT